jgi:hypothetical protein
LLASAFVEKTGRRPRAAAKPEFFFNLQPFSISDSHKIFIRRLFGFKFEAGLPDDILYFQTKNPKLGKFWRPVE